MKNALAPRVERRQPRLTADEEHDITERIWSAEEEAREAMREIPEARAALRPRRSSGAWTTRVIAVELLKDGIRASEEAARRHPPWKDAASRARAAWDRAQRLRWELALSAAHVLPGEARRVAAASELEEADLVNEGFLGLLRAATRYDPARGVRFATYGRWWARAQMTRAVDAGGRAVRLTGAAVEQLRNLRRAQTARERANQPTSVAELAADTGIDIRRAEALLAVPKVVSLETPLSSDDPDGQRLGDRIAIGGEDAEQATTSADLQEQLRVAVAAIPDVRARQVLSRHYGLAETEPCTLGEIGLDLSLSRERIRQIELSAIRWLREESGLVADAGEDAR